MDRAIEEVIDMRTGKILYASDIFASSEEDTFKLRRQLREAVRKEQSLLACSICQQPVLLSGFKTGGFFFKHHQELGDCPIKTKGRYSQDEINRMKYNGLKESEAHRTLKHFIYETLCADSRFQDVRCEEVVKGGGLLKEWRKPDVSSIFGDKPLVWEIQLSTTYHNVIVDRECFYRDNATYIMWVFKEFDTERLRFTEKDIYWQNKANAFVIDERTKALSEERGELVLDCRYLEPRLIEGRVEHFWRSQDVTVADLKFDQETFKVYYHDLDDARSVIRLEQLRQELRDFEDYWLSRHRLDFETMEQRDAKYCRLLSRLQPVQLDRFDRHFSGVLNALYSAKHGKVVGSDLPNLNAVANNTLEYYKEYTRVFARALKYYGRHEDILAADIKKGRFKAKVDRYRQAIKEGDPAYRQNSTYNQLFIILFPELTDFI